MNISTFLYKFSQSLNYLISQKTRIPLFCELRKYIISFVIKLNALSTFTAKQTTVTYVGFYTGWSTSSIFLRVATTVDNKHFWKLIRSVRACMWAKETNKKKGCTFQKGEKRKVGGCTFQKGEKRKVHYLMFPSNKSEYSSL